MRPYDVAVIGGGLAGLVAAIDLTRAGKSVVVLEKSNRLGGRAITVNKSGALFNMGVHAVYRGGAGDKIFQELGVKLEGGKPSTNSFLIYRNEAVSPASALLTSRLLPWSGRMELGRLFVKLGKIDAMALPAISVREWVEQSVRDPMVRKIVLALLRASSYTQDPDNQVIGTVLDQVQRGNKNGVLYLHGGWQTIVHQLHQLAVRAGVTVLSSKSVTEIEHDGQVRRIRFADGETMAITHVISTAPPGETYRLVRNSEETALRRWKEQARPSKAACLDLALKRLPVKGRNLALGIDWPVFFTNQSGAGANLSDNGTVVAHVIKHNGVGETDPKADERMLEQTMDLLHPGWRQEVVARQYLPNITVAHDYHHLLRTDRHPGPAVPEIRGLYVAGEWATHGEILSDAAAASGRRAARQVLISS